MRVIFAAAMIMAVALAGCAGDDMTAEEPEKFTEAKASSTKGVIRGVVVDSTITPVEGATVRTTPGELSTITDGDGAFVFNDLEPGVYFLDVTAQDHTRVQANTEVVAGVDKPGVVRVMLEYIPPPEPFVQEITWKFFMDGSAMVAGNGIVLGNFLGQGSFGKNHEIMANSTWVQSELVWEQAQPLASWMQMGSRLLGPESNIDSETVRGPSPLLQVFDNRTVDATGVGYTLFVYHDDATPVGVTAAQELTMFTHVFAGFLPDDGWQFTSDGAHPLP